MFGLIGLRHYRVFDTFRTQRARESEVSIITTHEVLAYTRGVKISRRTSGGRVILNLNGLVYTTRRRFTGVSYECLNNTRDRQYRPVNTHILYVRYISPAPFPESEKTSLEVGTP